MSYQLFGAKKTFLSYTSASAAFSATPNFMEAGKEPALAYYSGVLETIQEVTEVVIEIAAEADQAPAPAAPQTLQDLVQAGRARLKKGRARHDRVETTAALAHVIKLRELIAP